MAGCVQNGAVCSECVFRMALCVQSVCVQSDAVCSECVCVQSGAVCSEYVFRVALCVQSGAVCSECVFRVTLCVQSGALGRSERAAARPLVRGDAEGPARQREHVQDGAASRPLSQALPQRLHGRQLGCQH